MTWGQSFEPSGEFLLYAVTLILQGLLQVDLVCALTAHPEVHRPRTDRPRHLVETQRHHPQLPVPPARDVPTMQHSKNSTSWHRGFLCVYAWLEGENAQPSICCWKFATCFLITLSFHLCMLEYLPHAMFRRLNCELQTSPALDVAFSQGSKLQPSAAPVLPGAGAALAWLGSHRQTYGPSHRGTAEPQHSKTLAR